MNSKKQLILLGGGHSHVEVLRRFAKRPPKHAEITLVSRELNAPYSGMIPGHIAGHYTADACHIDLGRLAARAGARFVHAAARGLDLEGQTVALEGDEVLPYDLLSVNVGSRPSTLEVPGAARHAIAVKPVDELLEQLKEAFLRIGITDRPFDLVVAGGGAGGVELMFAIRRRIERDYPVAWASGLLRFHLVTASETLLPGHNSNTRARILRALAGKGVHVRTVFRIARVDSRFLRTAGDSALPYDALFWATHAAAAPWIQATGIETDPAGFILVDSTLRSVSHPAVFAAGDVATIREHPRPKSGVYAVRAGPVLAENLRHSLAGEPLTVFKPQRAHLSLLTTGGKYAIASWGNWSAEGRWVWWWKNHIDTRFMRRYR